MVQYKAIRNTPVYNLINGQLVLPSFPIIVGTGQPPFWGDDTIVHAQQSMWVKMSQNYNGYPSFVRAADVVRYYSTRTAPSLAASNFVSNFSDAIGTDQSQTQQDTIYTSVPADNQSIQPTITGLPTPVPDKDSRGFTSNQTLFGIALVLVSIGAYHYFNK